MNKDKNGETLKVKDYICICNKYLVQIHEFPSVGIGISVENICNGPCNIDLNCLKMKYKKKANTQGLIPLSFLDITKIEKCTKEERPELCI